MAILCAIVSYKVLCDVEELFLVVPTTGDLSRIVVLLLCAKHFYANPFSSPSIVFLMLEFIGVPRRVLSHCYNHLVQGRVVAINHKCKPV